MIRDWRGHRGLVAGIVVAALACAAPQVASAETVPLPGGATTGSTEYNGLTGIACPGAGDCVASGWYDDVAGNTLPLLETQSAGVWTVQPLSLASLPSLSSSLFVELDGISCTSVGNCVAIGSYDDAAGNQQGLIATETNGTWAVSPLPLSGLPSTAPDPQVVLNSVTCPAAGSCVAVGSYQDGSGNDQALIAVDAGGTWTVRKADLSSFTTYSNPYASLAEVSCASVGNCAAVGSWRDATDNDEGLIETETGGVWSTSKPDLSHLPSVASTVRDVTWSVSCPSVGGCTIAGYYLDGSAGGGTDQGMLITQSGGSWAPATEAQAPTNAAPTGADVQLYALSCTSAGDCTAVGDYRATASAVSEGLVLTETGGSWGSSVEFNLPAGAAANPKTYMSSIACTAPGSCVAGGSFDDASGANDVLVAEQSAGNWTTAGLPQPTTAGAFPVNSANVACTATGGYCAMAGATLSWAGSNADVSYLLDTPAAVPTPSASVAGTQATVSWSAPADNGGLPLTGYAVTATDLTAASRGGQSTTTTNTSATLSGLAPGDTYTFTVTPASMLGNGLTATTADVLVPFSTQQLAATLTGLLAPHGAASRLKRLHRAHAYTFLYSPLESGTVSVRWYEWSGHGRHRRKHLFASGSAATSGTTAVKVRVRLTGFGRRAVTTGHRLHLSATVTFASQGTKVIRTHRFTLH